MSESNTILHHLPLDLIELIITSSMKYKRINFNKPMIFDINMKNTIRLYEQLKDIFIKLQQTSIRNRIADKTCMIFISTNRNDYKYHRIDNINETADEKPTYISFNGTHLFSFARKKEYPNHITTDGFRKWDNIDYLSSSIVKLGNVNIYGFHDLLISIDGIRQYKSAIYKDKDIDIFNFIK